MDVAEHRIWDGTAWVSMQFPASEGRPLAMAAVAAVVWRDPQRTELLLQRRDRPHEPVYGCLEVPSGRWLAGEHPAEVVRREVAEEAGLEVTFLHDEASYEAHARRPFVTTRPLLVTVGVGGSFPVVHVVYECVAAGGELRPLPGETADPQWWPLADVSALLAEPAAFTGPTFAILTELLEPGR